MSEQNKLSTQSLDNKNEDIAQQIIDANTVEETRDLTALFNLNAQKRNVLRILKMNNLLDKVTDQMIERFEKTPGAFSNKDYCLIQYPTFKETVSETTLTNGTKINGNTMELWETTNLTK